MTWIVGRDVGWLDVYVGHDVGWLDVYVGHDVGWLDVYVGFDVKTKGPAGSAKRTVIAIAMAAHGAATPSTEPQLRV